MLRAINVAGWIDTKYMIVMFNFDIYRGVITDLYKETGSRNLMYEGHKH